MLVVRPLMPDIPSFPCLMSYGVDTGPSGGSLRPPNRRSYWLARRGRQNRPEFTILRLVAAHTPYSGLVAAQARFRLELIAFETSFYAHGLSTQMQLNEAPQLCAALKSLLHSFL